MAPVTTVAVVDDDEETRLIVHDILASEGYAVVEAASGDDALTLLRTAPASLVVLLDEWLPDLPGTAILSAAENDPALRRHCFILCTASPQQNPERRAIRERVGAAMLAKPFDIDDLLRLVADAAARLP